MSFFERLLQRLEEPRFFVTIVKSERVGGHLQCVRLALDGGQTWEPPVGSYLAVLVGDAVPRAYTLAEANQHGGAIIVSLGRQGVGARFFAEAPVGTRMSAMGPFIDLNYIWGTQRPKLFVATGSGVAPFVRMVSCALREGLPARLLLGSPREVDLPYDAYFRNLAAQHPNFAYLPMVSRRTANHRVQHGHVTDVLWQQRLQLPQYDVYVCGVEAMLHEVKTVVRHAHVPRDQVLIESFG